MEIVTSHVFWLNVSRLLILLFTGAIALMTYRSSLLLKRIVIETNILLSPAESVVRLVLVGLCFFFAWLSGLDPVKLGLVIDDPWRMVGWGLGLGIVIQLVINLVTTQTIKVFGRDIYSPWLIQNILPRRSSEWPLIALAFIPPVLMEEMLFRTLLIGVFQDIIPLPLLILVTSIVFGLMHQPQGKLGMIITGVINIIFCVLFIWSGQLLLTFIVHYTINCLQVVFAFHQRAWLKNH
ncbi:MAG: CPBP family intramembrane metalloprotease [Anaerolineae bacterium]|nr:CPBP family intramembrane metalloprotease [Anaerolineae bacterium]